MKRRTVQPVTTVNAEVTVPGSKSLTARALVIGALGRGETILRNALVAGDIHDMIQGLEALGVRIDRGAGCLRILGTGGRLTPPETPLFLGGAGTAVRFLTAAAGLSGGRVMIDGNKRMRERPIQDLLDGLAPLGIRARAARGDGCPPVLIEKGRFQGGRTTLRGGTSSQFLSAILLSGPCGREPTEVEVRDSLVSGSYVDLTLKIMRDFGAHVTHRQYRTFQVMPGPYEGRAYWIEGDMSSASYCLAAAAITGGHIRVRGINPHTLQGDRGLVDVLETMGCRVRWNTDAVELMGRPLRGVTVDMARMPDAVQTLAVAAGFATGETRLTGVRHLRYKETDRLAALRRELDKMGIRSALKNNGMVIWGGKPRGAEIDTYGDHRMAMSFAVAGLRVPGVAIRDPECVGKSFPDFWEVLETLR